MTGVRRPLAYPKPVLPDQQLMAGSVRPRRLQRAAAHRLTADLGLRLRAAGRLSSSNVSSLSKLTSGVSPWREPGPLRKPTPDVEARSGVRLLLRPIAAIDPQLPFALAAWAAAVQRVRSADAQLRSHGHGHLPVVESASQMAARPTGFEGTADLQPERGSDRGRRLVERLLPQPANSRTRPIGAGGGFPSERPVYLGTRLRPRRRESR